MKVSHFVVIGDLGRIREHENWKRAESVGIGIETWRVERLWRLLARVCHSFSKELYLRQK